MGFLTRTIKKILTRTSTSQQRRQQAAAAAQPKPILPNLGAMLQRVQTANGDSSDVVIRKIKLLSDIGSIDAAVLYIDGLADTDIIMESLLHDLQESPRFKHRTPRDNVPLLLMDGILKSGEIRLTTDMEEIDQAMHSGDSVILIDGYAQGLIIDTRAWSSRSIEEPSSQTVIRGPKEGFTETLRTNTMLIRRRIRDTNLRVDARQIGKVTKTDIAVLYIQGIANEKALNEVMQRLDRINIDAVLESSYIEELIQDETATPFPTVFNTERPDVVAAGLLEGRIAIVVDGTPFVLLVPALFVHFFQTAEDYYQRADIGTLLRLLRYLCFFIALLAPSAYVAASNFHQEMIPTQLLIRIAAQREGVPFPALMEALLMEIIFEILREAGVRMPRAIGQAVSIVGALVIGQAAVDAGLVGPAMVIVVSITAISNFVIPSFNMGISIRILRFPLMALAATFGLYGIMVGLIATVLHLCSLRSFGIPYMSPFAPFIPDDQKDGLIRLPHWALFSRPRLISQNNMTRERNNPSNKQ